MNWSLCRSEKNNFRLLEYLLLVYYLLLLLLLSYLSYRNSRVRVPQFREEGQSCVRSAIAIIITTCVLLIAYIPVNDQLIKLPLPPHVVLFWVITAYVVISPVAIFGVLLVPKVRRREDGYIRNDHDQSFSFLFLY